MSKSSVFAIIPARGGSKGLSNKNIVDLNGSPLIAYTLGALLGASEVANHIVSTDDEAIAAIARRYGGEVPYLRSSDLAQDNARINDVVRKVLVRLNVKADYTLLLQPTAPLRTAADIDAAIKLAREHDADSVVSLAMMETYHPWGMYYVKGTRMEAVGSVDHALPRQRYPLVGWRNGAIYLVKREIFLDSDTFVTSDCVPYMMPSERSVNIDTEDDLRSAEHYLQKSALQAPNRKATAR